MRKKKLYVVGYDEEGRRVFGDIDGADIKTFTYPVTAYRAKKMHKALFDSGRAEKAIYKLVKVDPKKI